MEKLLLDTNIYGLIVADQDRKEIHQAVHSSAFLVFGFEVIRKELRDTPKSLILRDKNLRIDLLSVYDDLVKKSYPLDPEMEDLAESYFTAYRKFGGNISKDKIFPYFLIVACGCTKDGDYAKWIALPGEDKDHDGYTTEMNDCDDITTDDDAAICANVKAPEDCSRYSPESYQCAICINPSAPEVCGETLCLLELAAG